MHVQGQEQGLSSQSGHVCIALINSHISHVPQPPQSSGYESSWEKFAISLCVSLKTFSKGIINGSQFQIFIK